MALLFHKELLEHILVVSELWFSASIVLSWLLLVRWLWLDCAAAGTCVVGGAALPSVLGQDTPALTTEQCFGCFFKHKEGYQIFLLARLNCQKNHPMT